MPLQGLTVIGKPLSIDSPDFATAKAGLEAHDLSRGTPVLSAISPLRMQMFDLLKIKPFRPIPLISENLKDGAEAPGLIGSAKQAYALLPEGHPALQCFERCLVAEGFDVLVTVQDFYS
jgi:hypothetical protein